MIQYTFRVWYTGDRFMVVCGIDPGLRGAIVFLDDFNNAVFYKMPIINKNVVDVCRLKEMIDEHKPKKAIVEKQFILRRQRGNMTIATNYGRILSVLELSKCDYKIVTAKSWQKRVGASGDKVAHIQRAFDLGFDVPRKSNRKNSPYNDNVADAYLIAKSGQITGKKK